MKLRILVIVAVAAALVVVPSTASAKLVAENVTITGPGLREPVYLENPTGPKGVSVWRLAEATGLYHTTFRSFPNPLTDTQPAGRLGPRYSAVFEIPASGGALTPIHQELYPFAKAGFVTYTPSDQGAFGSVPGGWYVRPAGGAGPRIDGKRATAVLVALGARDRRA